jgi:hypothetical protein
MTSTSNGKPKPKKPTVKGLGSAQSLDPRLLDLDLKFFASPKTSQPVRVDKATDEEFDLFIRQYIVVGWTLEDRLDALVAAIRGGQQPKFLAAENLGADSNFLGSEHAQEGK